jgi:hypothetical protein
MIQLPPWIEINRRDIFASYAFMIILQRNSLSLYNEFTSFIYHTAFNRMIREVFNPAAIMQYPIITMNIH